MSDIQVTSIDGQQINVSTGTVVGPLPQLQVAAGNGITIQSGGGVSTISANLSDLSIPANLSDLADVKGTPAAGQVLAWNGTTWAPADDQTGGASDVANLADLSDVSATSPSSGQALTWGGSQWEAANVPVGTTVNGLSGNVTLLAGDNINVSADGQNITIGTIGQASISNITDLLDVNATMSPTSGQALVWDGAVWTADSVTALVSNGTTLDLGTGKILYSNVYATLNDLPAAADYHGMFAHVHNYDGLGTGAAFYAHAGNWVRLADSDDVPTTLVSGINGLSGQIVLAAGAGTLISQAGNQLTISSTQTFTTLNGEAGALTLAAGDNVQISTQDGLITVSASDSSTVNGLTGNVSIVAGANINVATTGQNVVISGEQGGIQWVSPPQNSSAPGSPGDVAYDDNYLYLRTSQAWRQVALQPISTAITISQQPQNTTVGDGGSATFAVLANAPEAISYQWSSSTDGTSFAAINGATSNTLTINATLADNGSQYRALLSAAGAADVTTDVATLTVNETFRLLTANNDTLLTEAGDTLNHDGVGGGGGGGNLIVQASPQNITVAAGNDATFSATLEPAENWYIYDMKWQRADSGSPNSWSVVETESLTGYDISSSSNVTQNYTWTSASAFDDGDLFRVTGSAFEYGLVHTSGALRSKYVVSQGRVWYGLTVSGTYFSVTQGGTIQAQYLGEGLEGQSSSITYSLAINGASKDSGVTAENGWQPFGGTHAVSAGDQVAITYTVNIYGTNPDVILLFTPAAGLQETVVTSPPATLTVT